MRDRDFSLGETAVKVFSFCLFAVGLYFVLRYALGVLFPFALAYVISCLIRPVVNKTVQKTRMPRGLCAGVCVGISVAILFSIFAFLVSHLFSEAREFLSSERGGLDEFKSLVDALKRPFDLFLDKYEATGSIDKIIASIESKVFELISSFLSGAVSTVIKGAPAILIGGVVCIMSSYYFSVDGEKICEGIKKALPQKYRDNVINVLLAAGEAMKKYAKAYLFIMLITFAEVFLGLLLLDVDYALISALIISIVDILPVLGAGAILLPWAVALMLIGNTSKALGLLILYGIITIVRQIAEPHIVGSTIGLHPAMALFSMYVGMRLFGVLGMIFCPAIAFVFTEIIKERIKN